MESNQTLGWFLTWLIFGGSIFLTAKILPTFKVNGFITALWVAAVYGLLKVLLYNILIFLSLPFIAITLGLFLFVVNAILLWLTDKLVKGIKIKGFLHTIIASVIITLIDVALKWVVASLV